MAEQDRYGLAEVLDAAGKELARQKALIAKLAEALRDTINLAEAAMHAANQDIASYQVADELRDARAALAAAGKETDDE